MSQDNVQTRRAKVEIHDRLFQKYSLDHQIYCVPVDSNEEERLDGQHTLLEKLHNGRLYLAPIDVPEKVLECGYGTGSWAIAMAEQYPESEVIGIDIYPGELPYQPENLDCCILNLNERQIDGLYEDIQQNTFDLIHSRFVGPGIKKQGWIRYVRNLRRLLKSGGWVQMAEYYYNFQSRSGRLTDNHKLRQWYLYYAQAMEVDRDPRVGRSLGHLMREAGLVDIQYWKEDIPIGDWHTDPKQKEIGLENCDNVAELLDSHAIWPFTQRLGWSQEQFDAFTDQAREEAGDASLKLYIEIHFAIGRKR